MSFPRYPKYKASGVEWLGDVPEGWTVLPLKRIVSVPITDGPHETPQFVEEGVPFVSAEAVSSGQIDFTKVRACISLEDNARYSKKYSPKRHDIYMVKSGATTGVTAIVEDRTDFNIWSPLAVIRCNSGSVPHFVLNFMRSRPFLEAVTLFWSFGTQQNIGMGVIENLACTVPPLAEQTAIAEFLDRETGKIDGLVAEQRRLMELLKEKRQAVISHAVTKGLNPHAPMKPSGIEWLGDVPVGWEVKPLRSVFKFSKGLTITKEDLRDEGVCCVNYGEIHSKYGFLLNPDIHPLRCVETEYLNSNPDALISDGDFVFADTSEDLEGSGNFTHLRSDNQIFAGYHTIIARPQKGICSLFLAYQFHSSLFRSQIQRQVKGVKVFSISQGILKSAKCWLPPLPEQTAIVAFLETELAKFDTLTAEAQRATDLLQERRTALISAAVTGQIDVRQQSRN
ncbi:MAG: restriction endonuclease subunit S [Pirellula sp.]|nr:restriction endonuclease subunit S [Pirellula sp.]